VSTKMYHGYRIPYSKLGEFTDLFDAAAFDTVTAFLDKAVTAMVPDSLAEGWEKRVPEGISKENAAPFLALCDFFFLAVVAHEQCHHPGNVDTCFNAWPYKRHWYIQPIFASVCEPPDIVGLAPYVEEYGYWDNTDMPEHLTERQWRRRGDTWDAVCLSEPDAWHKRRFAHTTIEAALPWLPGFNVLEQRIRERHTWPYKMDGIAQLGALSRYYDYRDRKRKEATDAVVNSQEGNAGKSDEV